MHIGFLDLCCFMGELIIQMLLTFVPGKPSIFFYLEWFYCLMGCWMFHWFRTAVVWRDLNRVRKYIFWLFLLYLIVPIFIQFILIKCFSMLLNEEQWARMHCETRRKGRNKRRRRLPRVPTVVDWEQDIFFPLGTLCILQQKCIFLEVDC